MLSYFVFHARETQKDIIHLIRRGGAPSGAAELLARGGMGATAPILWIRFQSPVARTAPYTFL
jgi:hypothetical protein